MTHNGNMAGKLKELLAEVVGDDTLSGKIHDGSDIINEIGLDSIQMINFILMIEDEFGIEIDFENFDYANFERFDSLCRFVGDILECQAVS